MSDEIPARKRRRAPGEVSGTRKEHDVYDTDPRCALACVEWVRDRIVGYFPDNEKWHNPKILDPTAGMGPWVKAARTCWPGALIAASDIREECRAACLESGATKFAATDALTLPDHVIHAADLIVTNPPFTLADALVRHFWLHMKPGAVLAFLLNITFLASTDRWRPNDDPDGLGLFTIAPLQYALPIVPRPAFLVIDGKKCSGMFEAALFVWRKLHDGEPYTAASIPGPIRWKKEG